MPVLTHHHTLCSRDVEAKTFWEKWLVLGKYDWIWAKLRQN